MMKLVFRIVLWICGGAAALLLVAVLYAAITWFRAADAPLPTYEGEAVVEGAAEPVTIRRDRFAIAHIEALSEADAWFALGFVHAQDRLFQMDLVRRGFSGRLSALIGAPGLPADRIAHLGDLPAVAERSWSAYPDEARAMIEAYTAGVNAYLRSDFYAPTPEHVLLHADIEPWTALDTVSASLQFSNFFGPFNDGGALFLERLNRHAPAEDAAALIRPYRADTPAHLEDSGPVVRFARPVKAGELSNAWAVDGRFTASGAPLLANDPQLPTTSPGVWYLVRLSWPGREVAGVSAPGMPGVFVGRNDTSAWGVTYASVETSDASLLTRDPDDPDRYLSSAGPRAYEVTTAEIEVRFGGVERYTIRRSPAGVVVPPELQRSPLVGPDQDLVILNRSDVTECDCMLAGVMGLNRAGSVAEMIEAMAVYRSAAINLVLADSAGSIGYVMPGGIPARPASIGGAIVDNPEARPPFTALVPPEENPMVIDPPRGRIISANQAVAGSDYPHYLNDFPADTNRARRIAELLEARSDHDPDTFSAMQADTLSIAARTMLPHLLRTEPAAPEDAVLLDFLAGWDGRYELDSAAPLVFGAWIHALNTAIFTDDLGSETVLVDTDARLISLTAVFDGDLAHWCDDRNTALEESCADMLVLSLGRARAALEARWGRDPAAWRWGDAAEYTAPHLAFGGVPLLDGAFSRRIVFPGGPDTNRVFGVFWPEAADPEAGRYFSPSLQMVVDLAEPEAARFSLSAGQSGHFRSPHYADLAEIWMAGGHVTVHDPGADARTLRLVPHGD